MVPRGGASPRHSCSLRPSVQLPRPNGLRQPFGRARSFVPDRLERRGAGPRARVSLLSATKRPCLGLSVAARPRTAAQPGSNARRHPTHVRRPRTTTIGCRGPATVFGAVRGNGRRHGRASCGQSRPEHDWLGRWRLPSGRILRSADAALSASIGRLRRGKADIAADRPGTGKLQLT